MLIDNESTKGRMVLSEVFFFKENVSDYLKASGVSI